MYKRQLNVHYTAPHAPWTRENHPQEKFDAFYNDSRLESTPDLPIHPNQLDKESGAATIGSDEEGRKIALSGYFTAIEEMDRNIGRIIDWLEENDLRDNTLIIFTADNGMNMGHHGIWGKGNGTYPPNMYDTAVKIPTLVSRLGHVPQNVACTELLSQYDFSPTLLDYVGLEQKNTQNLPGRSFVNLLEGRDFGSDKPVYVLDEYGPTRMIRTHKWKYVHRYQFGDNELYDLENDPDEEINLFGSDAHQEIGGKLLEQLESWYDKYTDPSVDGRKNSVMGRGQIGMIKDSDKPFADDVVYFNQS